MKRIVIFLLIFVAASCSNGEGTNSVKSENALGQGGEAGITYKPYSSISPIQAMELMKINKNILVVDVRSAQELRQGKIEGSVLVPFWNVMKGSHSLPKDRPIILVCAVGGRSYAAMQIMAKQGYPEIYNLKGGMSSWARAKLPVVY